MRPNITLVETLVREAAREELLPRFRKVARHQKPDGSWLTEADLAMQARLHAELAARWPAFGFLGEEMSAQEQARILMTHAGEGAEVGYWVLDPLDGTSNYSAGLPVFSVSLALMCGGRVVLGVVYDPMLDESFAAVEGAGATLNGEPLQARTTGIDLTRALACVDFKRLPPALAARIVSNAPYGSQRSIGSVALDWCWVAAGRFHVYLHGRQSLWDYAAGALILAEAGGFSDTLDGEPASLSLKPRSALCATDAVLFAQWRDWLRGGG
ncbi:MAG: inositol monophosphatase [Pseudomonadota bacterium]